MRNQIIAVLFLTAGILEGSVISSGTITLVTSNVGLFDLTLGDGVHFGGTVNYSDFQQGSPQYCSGCVFALPLEVSSTTSVMLST